MSSRKMEQNSSKSSGHKDVEDEMQAEAAVETEEIEQLKSDLSAARTEAADTYDRLLRLSAEFENYKKRVQRQTEDYKKYANENLIKELLPVVDNLERALTAADDQRSAADSSMAEGVEMTLNEILKILEKYNVTPIEALGKPFDPTYHEAVMQQPSDQHPENTVIGEMQKGYMLHDRLIRPAMVVVSK